MKIFLVSLLALVTTGLCAQEKVIVNDPNAQVRNVSGFHEIYVSSGIDLYLSPDNKETVVVSAKEDKHRDRIVTTVENGRLRIYYNNKNNGWKWPMDMRLKAYVSFSQLDKLNASGSSDVYVNGVIKAERLSISLSGSSDFKGAVDVNHLSMDQSGSSDSQLGGRADNLRVDVSGASDLKGFDLVVNYCDAEASGASDIQVTVNKELSVRASGSSDVEYKGSAVTKEVKTSGSSGVSRKGK